MPTQDHRGAKETAIIHEQQLKWQRGSWRILCLIKLPDKMEESWDWGFTMGCILVPWVQTACCLDINQIKTTSWHEQSCSQRWRLNVLACCSVLLNSFIVVVGTLMDVYHPYCSSPCAFLPPININGILSFFQWSIGDSQTPCQSPPHCAFW